MARAHLASAGADNGAIVTHHDSVDVRAVGVGEPARVSLLKVEQHLLGQQAAVGGTGTGHDHGPVAVIVDLEQLVNPALRDNGVEPGELGGDLGQVLGVFGHLAFLRPQPCLAAKQLAGQMSLELVEVEHAHVAGEPLDTNGGAGLRHHHVQQVMGVIESALCVDGLGRAELLGDVRERPLEVGRQLAGVSAGRSPGDAVALDQQHAVRRRCQNEERRRNSRDPGTDHNDVGARLSRQRL